MTFVDLRDIFNFVFDSVNNALRVNVVAGGGGGGGGAVTVANGADTAEGSTTDAAAIGDVNGTAIAHLRGIATELLSGIAVSNFPATQPVSGTVAVSNFPATQPVSGTVAVSNFPVTQPVSGTVTANQGTQNAGGAAAWPIQGAAAAGGALPNPVVVGGENGGLVKLLHLNALGGPIVDQGANGTSGTGSWFMQGTTGATSSFTGFPVVAGAVDGSGLAQNLRVFSAVNPSLFVSSMNGNTLADATSNTTGQAVTQGGSSAPQSIVNMLFNGTSWDRQRANVDATLLASAARTTTQTSAPIVTYNLGAIAVYINVTANAGSITFQIGEVDPASGTISPILTGLAITGTGFNVYRVDPRCPDVANKNVQLAMPRVFVIVITANNAGSVTYSVGYTLKVV